MFSPIAITRGRTIAGVTLLAAVMLTYWPAAAPPGPRSLRQFDPDRMADLEVRMWQAYYGKERVRLFALLVTMLRDYRQRVLNTRVMLTLRRSRFDRFLHLPLPRLWDMKTGGILSRLTGDIDTTSGLMQMAVVSPTISVI